MTHKETLEEVSENKFGLVDPILGKSPYRMGYESGLIKGAKWQQERMFSEDEVINIVDKWVRYQEEVGDGKSISLKEFIQSLSPKEGKEAIPQMYRDESSPELSPSSVEEIAEKEDKNREELIQKSLNNYFNTL